MPSGVPLPRVGCVEVEEAMQAHPHYNAPLEGPYRGRGVAMGFWGNAGNQSSATINVNADGTISLITRLGRHRRLARRRSPCRRPRCSASPRRGRRSHRRRHRLRRLDGRDRRQPHGLLHRHRGDRAPRRTSSSR